MAKRIIHVITSFHEIGGAEQTLIKIINASKSGTEHTVVALMLTSELMKNQIHKDVKFYSLNAKSAAGLLISVFKLRKILKSFRFDVIYSWMYHANVIAALAKVFVLRKVPLIWGVRNSLDVLKGESVSAKIAVYVGKMMSFIPDKVVYCANRAMTEHVEFGYSTKNKSIYIPNGYDLEDYQKRLFQKEQFVLGAAGRFHDAKDYMTLFKAVAPILNKYEKIQLKIAGRDVENSNVLIKSYIRECNIRPSQIQLLGQLNDMPTFYRSVDFFILSSRVEGFPNVLAEATGYGCVTFSTDVGDAGLIINDDARIVKIGDATALTKLLTVYLNKTPNELSSIANVGANHIRTNYSIESISEKLLSLGNVQ